MAAMFRKTVASALLLWWSCFPYPVSAQEPAGDYFAYVGSYTNMTPKTATGSKGIYGFRFDSKSGALSSLGLVAETVNPAHLWASADGRFLYSVNWQTGDKAAGDTVSAYSVDLVTGHLTFLNRVSAHGDWANQVVLDPSGQIAVTVNFQSGTVAALPIEADGRLGEAFYTDQHAASSAGSGSRRPRAHGVAFSQDGNFVYVADVGLDRIYSYRLDATTRHMAPCDLPYLDTKSGSGPRRLQIHPNGRFLYANFEAGSSVSVFEVKGGSLQEIQSISTLPADFEGHNATAEIQIDRAGRFLYVSNRGQDSIACYRVDPVKGTLEWMENVSCLGRTPKNIRIDPTNHYLFSANLDSDSVVVFHIAPDTGRLTPTGVQAPVVQAGGIAFVKVPQ
jgi:6-phosphogluconolactonase